MRRRKFSFSMYSAGMRISWPRLSVARRSGGRASPFRSATARSIIWQYISKPTASMWPCCSPPSRLPAPRSSRSSAAIRKPAPRSLNSLKRREALAGDRSERTFRRDQKVRVGALVGAADAAAELIELGKAKAVGAIDEDGVGARDIEAVLDDGGGDENVRFVADEFQHHFFEFAIRASGRGRSPRAPWNERCDHGSEGCDRFDAIVHEENLAVARESLPRITR